MWILFTFGSAFFAGITSILAKCGIKKTDSSAATAIRTIVVLAMAWVMVLVVVPIDKLSILVTIAFSYVVFRERLSRKAAWGLILIVAGTLIMLIT